MRTARGGWIPGKVPAMAGKPGAGHQPVRLLERPILQGSTDRSSCYGKDCGNPHPKPSPGGPGKSMNMKRILFFIALMPPENLRQQITSLKQEARQKYGSAHALRLPPHITLQIPFKLEQDRESTLRDLLSDFAERQLSFKIGLSGFDCFSPRVIFARVRPHAPVTDLSERLQKNLAQFTGREMPGQSPMHPHVNIASRDLGTEAFHAMWAEFRDREFTASFQARSLFLFRHNGKTWDKPEEFFFHRTQANTS